MTRLFAELAIVAAGHVWVAWLFTYVVHSAALVAAIAGARRVLRLAPEDESALWRAALAAPALTALLPAVFGLRTPASFELPALAPTGFSLWAISAAALAPLMALPLMVVWRRRVARRVIARTFGARRPASAEIAAEVGGWARQFGVRLPRVTISDEAVSPAALGGDEICLPAQFAEWPSEVRGALLAHELAHIARRDPQWLRLAWFIRGLCPGQRFNTIAADALCAASERAADDRAAAIIGDRARLAEALTTAAAALYAPPGAATAPAALGSPIVQRVARLLEDPAESLPLRRPARWALAASLIAVTLAASPAARLTPDDAANRISWLRPGPEPPDGRLLQVRYAVRRVSRALHFRH